MRIIVTGPESTGKSTLAKHLAEHFDLPYAPEFAREYLEQNGPEYDYDGLGEMAALHIEWQNRHVHPNTPLGILDTDLLNYKIWCEVVFGECHPKILDLLPNEQEHRYLLCKPDIPWEPDSLRENPNDREELFQRHLDEINKLKRPYRIIEGRGEDRMESAKKAFKDLTSLS